jgi:hypothetical protein
VILLDAVSVIHFTLVKADPESMRRRSGYPVKMEHHMPIKASHMPSELCPYDSECESRNVAALNRVAESIT